MLQTREFANLNLTTQQLSIELVQQRKAQETSNTTFGDRLDGVQRDINDKHGAVADKLDGFHGDIQLRFNEADQLRMREELLKSLWFPEIDLRRSEIKEPAPDTLNWLFERRRKNQAEAKWSNFRQWLREDTSMYWISGKAGSGKSTLMAHIINDERTFEDLDVWRNGDKLEVLSFFFWRAGSDLQKNIRGLLRSLLYQLCRLRPSTSDAILSRLSSPAGMFPSWTERDLLGHITEAIKSTQSTRFCMFIDGLDEFKDPHDTLDSLVDHLNCLQDLGKVKVCVSSRPELTLVNRFKGLKQLRLQDLNYDDIKKFVHQSFVKTNLSKHYRNELVNDVVLRAEGVFLWASLVTQSLVQGSKAHDDPEIMQARLHSLPRDMNKLFEQMLSDVDDVYRESLALYVQLMMLRDSIEDAQIALLATSIPIIAMLQLKKPINSYKEFANECERKVTQIETRSSGLLQVYRHSFYVDVLKGRPPNLGLKFVNDQPCFNPRFTPKSEQLNRRRCGSSEPYHLMLNYEQKFMGWIHRSAFEFFAVLDKKSATLYKSSLSREELLRRISEGLTSYAGAAPTIRGPRVVRFDFVTVVKTISVWHDDNPALASALLDKLHATCLQLDPSELSARGRYVVADPDAKRYFGEILFWTECAYGNLWSYALSRVGHSLKETTSGSAIINLLVGCMHQAYRYNTTDADSFARLINSLADIVARQIAKAYEVGNTTRTPRLMRTSRAGPLFISSLKTTSGKISSFNCECTLWREPVSGGSMTIMTGLIYILDLYVRLDWKTSPKPELPRSLIVVMDITDLYVALNLRPSKIRVQISAKDFTKFFDRSISKDTLGSYISASSLDKPVRIMCTPSNKVAQIPDGPPGGAKKPPKEMSTMLETSELLFIILSTATSDKLLSLLSYRERWDVRGKKEVIFSLISNPQQREELCHMILQEIKSCTQGLNEDQQVIAAACVRESLLCPDGGTADDYGDDGDGDGDDDKDDDSDNS